MSKYSAYNITVRQARFDGELLYEARVAELPDVVEYAETYADAYDLALDTIASTAKIFKKKGKKMPQAIEPVDDFSGRVTLRIPKSLHKKLSEKAEREGVSLNHLISNSLEGEISRSG